MSCTALPALGLMTEKNLKSPDCRVNFLPRPKVGTECRVCFSFAVMDASAPSAIGGRHYVRRAKKKKKKKRNATIILDMM